MRAAGDRIAALDLIRGVAVLGILLINVVSFAGNGSAVYSPNLAAQSAAANEVTWLTLFVLVEGKMRALFSVLFGASLVLFIERANAAGADGQHLQRRRLGWLALFGYLHYLLLWDGDILFLYAVAGLGAIMLRQHPPLALAASALFLCVIWQGWGFLQWQGAIAREMKVISGSASAQERADHQRVLIHYRQIDRQDNSRIAGPGAALIAHKALDDPLRPLRIAFFALGETFSLILLGMALFLSGFFSGSWSRRQLAWLAVLGIGLGGAATAWFSAWAAQHGYPEVTMRFAVSYGLTLPHFAMALGYAGALMLAWKGLVQIRPGRLLVAAGRMALSNYIATSLVMCAIFYGWGLSLAGRLDLAAQTGIALAGIAAMLAWSGLWLKQFRQGPLEWTWRRLTHGGNHSA